MSNLKSYQFVSMTTNCIIDIYDNAVSNIEESFFEISKETRRLELKYNFYNENSYLSKIINNRDSNKIYLDEETSQILKTIRKLCEDTKGIFDISVGTINHCYKYKTIEEVSNCVASLKSKMGLENWSIKNNLLEFKHKETKLDLGGVIKEYAVDASAEILIKKNIKSAIVNFGGDLRVIGKKPDGNNFAVAIKNPKDKDKVLLVINLENQALTTSASYERKTIIENKEFSHICSTKDINNEIISSTVIGNSALACGVYSTSFMIDSKIDIPQNLKILLVDNDLRIHQNIIKGE